MVTATLTPWLLRRPLVIQTGVWPLVVLMREMGGAETGGTTWKATQSVCGWGVWGCLEVRRRKADSGRGSDNALTGIYRERGLF